MFNESILGLRITPTILFMCSIISSGLWTILFVTGAMLSMNTSPEATQPVFYPSIIALGSSTVGAYLSFQTAIAAKRGATAANKMSLIVSAVSLILYTPGVVLLVILLWMPAALTSMALIAPQLVFVLQQSKNKPEN